MKLTELSESAGGMDYSAEAVAIIRLLKQSDKDRKLRRLMNYVGRECQK